MNQVIDKRKTVELSKLEPKTLSDWAQCKSCSNWWRVSKGMFNWAQKNDWYCRHIGKSCDDPGDTVEANEYDTVSKPHEKQARDPDRKPTPEARKKPPSIKREPGTYQPTRGPTKIPRHAGGRKPHKYSNQSWNPSIRLSPPAARKQKRNNRRIVHGDDTSSSDNQPPANYKRRRK